MTRIAAFDQEGPYLLLEEGRRRGSQHWLFRQARARAQGDYGADQQERTASGNGLAHAFQFTAIGHKKQSSRSVAMSLGAQRRARAPKPRRPFAAPARLAAPMRFTLASLSSRSGHRPNTLVRARSQSHEEFASRRLTVDRPMPWPALFSERPGRLAQWHGLCTVHQAATTNRIHAGANARPSIGSTLMESKTPWQDVRMPKFATLEDDFKCDVLIIGGGITGLTAAYLLTKAGQRVCVVDRQRIGQGDTGCTTAHLTCVTDARLSELVNVFGRDGARLAWGGGAAAVNTIEEIVRAEEIKCEFRRVPGFLHASLDSERDESSDLQRDCRLAEEFEFPAVFLPSVPHIGKPGIRFANQAKFHPMRYVAGLARAVADEGGLIFEESTAGEFSEGPRAVKINGHRVECGKIVMATHVPLAGESGTIGATLLQTKLASYSTYAIGAKIPRDAVPEASFWDTSDPYYYLRIDHGEHSDYAIFGGQDHKTGQAGNVESRFAELESHLHRLIPKAKSDRRWSGQVVETHDGLPYIGESAQGQFVATGFAGNGMTFGTLGGMMACDWALDRKNPWRDLLSVNRKKLHGVFDFVDRKSVV